LATVAALTTLAALAVELHLLSAAKHPAFAVATTVSATCVESNDERDDAENQRETGAYGEQYLLNLI
jgi:hypothetical protein